MDPEELGFTLHPTNRLIGRSLNMKLKAGAEERETKNKALI
jgi:hypothetical protein